MIQPPHAGHGQHHTGLRVLPVPREWLAARQNKMHAHGADATHGVNGPRDLALQRASLVDLLLKLGGGEAVGAVEDLVTDGAAGGQALVGQRQPCLGDAVGGHHDLAPVAGDAIRDVAARELIHNLRRVAQF